MFYITFNENGWPISGTNLKPEIVEGIDVFEVDDDSAKKFLFKDSEGIIREATKEELKIKDEQFELASTVQQVRNQRDILLQQSDSLVLPDRWAGYSSEKQAIISKYRQDLRDLTNQEGFPLNVEFPVLPT